MFRGRESRPGSRPGTPSHGHPLYDSTLPTAASLAGVPTNKLSSRARVNKANILSPSVTGPAPNGPREVSGDRYLGVDTPGSHPVRSHGWPGQPSYPTAVNGYHDTLPPTPSYSRSSSEYLHPKPQDSFAYTHAGYPPTTAHHPSSSYVPYATSPQGVRHNAHSNLSPGVRPHDTLSTGTSPNQDPIFPVRHRPLPPSPFSQPPNPSSPVPLSPLEQIIADAEANTRNQPVVPAMDSKRLYAEYLTPSTQRTLPFPALAQSPTSNVGPIIGPDDRSPPPHAGLINGTYESSSPSNVFSQDGTRRVPTGPNARIIRPHRNASNAPSMSLSTGDAQSDDSDPHATGVLVDEARSNRKLEDLKITNQSLLAVNGIYEDKIRTQRQRIYALERRLGLRSGATGSIDSVLNSNEGDPAGVDSGNCSEATDPEGGSLDTPPDEATLVATDAAFGRIVRSIETMISAASDALAYKPEINAGKVLSHAEVRGSQQVPTDLTVAQSVLDFINDEQDKVRGDSKPDLTDLIKASPMENEISCTQDKDIIDSAEAASLSPSPIRGQRANGAVTPTKESPSRPSVAHSGQSYSNGSLSAVPLRRSATSNEEPVLKSNQSSPRLGQDKNRAPLRTSNQADRTDISGARGRTEGSPLNSRPSSRAAGIARASLNNIVTSHAPLSNSPSPGRRPLRAATSMGYAQPPVGKVAHERARTPVTSTLTPPVARSTPGRRSSNAMLNSSPFAGNMRTLTRPPSSQSAARGTGSGRPQTPLTSGKSKSQRSYSYSANHK
ncbi:hypothetical protein IWQ62_005211 [Dispira parvispora]|uniref:Uncharacterized protein n=1 Tax=Dispira parvispora TaxID=1520584 RepID=A0A9W8E4X6_9FUNG|nr:hypothetical protein IWQ62_005211 [Dispira parvispora]